MGWAGLVVLLVAPSAFANLRAPQTGEGGFSGAVRAAPPTPILRHERMSIGFDTDAEGVPRTAVFNITYEVDAPAAVDLPLEFLGVAVDRPEITVAARDVDFDRRTDRKLQRELIGRLVAHRCAYRPQLGRSDDLRIDLLRRLAGDGARLDCDQPERLRERAERVELRGLGIYDKLDEVAFVAHLAAGENRILVRYRQPLFVAEGDYSSSEFGLRGAALGFDYLLYPARSWTIDPRFRLEVELSLPHPRVRGVFRDSYAAPRWRSNLALTDASPKKVPLTYLRGSFAGLPADIFTFVYSVP